jgi:hypothetical protein
MSKEQPGREINECQDELITKTLVPEQKAKTRFIMRSGGVLNNSKTRNLTSDPTATYTMLKSSL